MDDLKIAVEHRDWSKVQDLLRSYRDEYDYMQGRLDATKEDLVWLLTKLASLDPQTQKIKKIQRMINEYL